jgi:ribose 5-phosphate isomerase RpiB
MHGNGQPGQAAAAGAQVLHWSGCVLAAEDVRRSLNGHREVVLAPRAIATPLALEQLRTNGVAVTRQALGHQPQPPACWGYAQERSHPTVQSAVQAVQREGLVLNEIKGHDDTVACRWAKSVAECVARGECQGGAVFCQDPALFCCVSNKVPGLRAAAVVTVAQAAQAALTLGANLFVVEMPGRTFFEVRQILRILCLSGESVCPPGVACTLKELDGHAHR